MNAFRKGYDTSLYLEVISEEQREKTMESLFGMMRERGWNIGQDPYYLENYPTLAKDHFYGKKGDLEVVIEKGNERLNFEFYQNIVVENQNGGKYDFNKYDKMPYLIKLTYRNELRHIADLLLASGFEDKSDTAPKHALQQIFKHQRESIHRKLDAYGEEIIDVYNNKDKDGKTLKSGQVKYFRDHKGCLMRGVLYHNINNMWWVYLSKDGYGNKGRFSFFDLDTEENRLRKIIYPNEQKKAANMRSKLEQSGQIQSSKSLIENYEFKQGRSWANFTLDPARGNLSIKSGCGSWDYSWYSHGRKTLKHFLFELNLDPRYLKEKLSGGREFFNAGRTIERLKEEIVEMRRQRDMKRGDAREIWDFIASRLDERMTSENYFREIYDCTKLWDYFDHENIPCSMEVDPNLTLCVSVFYSAFAQLIKKEIGEWEKAEAARTQKLRKKAKSA